MPVLSLFYTEEQTKASLPIRTLQAAEKWSGKIELTASNPQVNLIRCNLTIEDLLFNFHVGVKTQRGLTYQHVGPPEILKPGQSGEITLRLSNSLDRPLQGQLGASAPTLPSLQVHPSVFAIAAHGEIDVKVSYVPGGSGLHEVQLQFVEYDGRLWTLEDLFLPVLGVHQSVAYEERGDYVLESQALQVRVNKSTGSMEIMEKTTGRIAITEAWPDIGPPFFSGVKRGAGRQLDGICTRDERGAYLSILEKTRDGGHLVRNIWLQADHLVYMKQEWKAGAAHRGQPKQFKTHGWCNFRKAMLSVPLRSGMETKVVVYEDYPYMVHDFECLRGHQLPWQRDAYAGEWSAFQEDRLVAGMLWKGATEIRYGLRWMPSLVFELADTTGYVKIPDYAYYVGSGGARTVERAWKKIFLLDKTLSDLPVEPPSTRAVVQLNGLRATVAQLLQRIEMPRIAETGNVSVKEISDRKGNNVYRVDNGLLQFQVAPQFAGSIYQLAYKGENMFQSAYPNTRTFGQNPVWYGGLHPHRLPSRDNLLDSILPNGYTELKFRASLAEEQSHDDQSWHGITLHSEGLCIKYLTSPRSPLLRLVTQVENVSNVSQTFDLVFHTFLRSLAGSREKKTFYYERLGQMHNLAEARKRRKVYTDDWGVVSVGKGMYVSFFAPPEENLEIAAYEWPQEGLQNALLQKILVAPGQIRIYQAYLLFSDSFEDALTYAMAIGKARALEGTKV